MKRNWKAGVCAALCSAMVFTGIGPVLTPYLENAVVYADENENSGVKKVFTADQLKVAWGDADYELADGQWKLSFAKQYNQVKWTLPESIEMSLFYNTDDHLICSFRYFESSLIFCPFSSF